MLLFMTAASFCQENYKPGYILLMNGDTLHGLLDYRNWERNPEKIAFKEATGDTRSLYFPWQIKGFGVLDETYESAVVQVENSPTETKDLNYDKTLVLAFDSAFLQAVVKGNKSLYYYKTRFGKELFYIKQDSAFKLLVYKKYLKDQDGESVLAENKTYIGQLTLYLADCSTIQDKLKNVAYQKNSLEALMLDYYACTQSKVAFHKKTEKTTVQFGAMAGATLTTLKFTGSYLYLVNAGYQPSVNFTAGLFLDVVFPRNHGKWSINNELICSSYKVDGRYDIYTNENKYTIVYTTIGYTYLKINNMVRFKYPVGKFFLYLNGGLSNGFAITEKNYYQMESKLYDDETVTEGKALNETRKWEFGYLVGLGTKFKKFSLEVRFERANGMSVYENLKSITYRYFCLVGYRF